MEAGRDHYSIGSINITLCPHGNSKAVTHLMNETPVRGLLVSYHYCVNIQSQNDLDVQSEFDGFSPLLDRSIQLIASVNEFVKITYAAVVARFESWY
jgi:hypothetical protein